MPAPIADKARALLPRPAPPELRTVDRAPDYVPESARTTLDVPNGGLLTLSLPKKRSSSKWLTNTNALSSV